MVVEISYFCTFYKNKWPCEHISGDLEEAYASQGPKGLTPLALGKNLALSMQSISWIDFCFTFFVRNIFQLKAEDRVKSPTPNLCTHDPASTIISVGSLFPTHNCHPEAIML